MDENESITQYLRGWLSYEDYNRFSEAWYIADRIDERFTHELEAKHDEVDALRSDNADLQARLDASIQPLTDANDEVCYIGDKMSQSSFKETFIVRGFTTDCLVDEFKKWHCAAFCYHVAPEPPEQPDSQERIDADAKKNACEYFGSGSNGYACDGCQADGTAAPCNLTICRDLLRRQRELDARKHLDGPHADKCVTDEVADE